MAAPNPEKELTRLRSVLEGEIPRVLVLQGPARWFRDRALDEIRRKLAGELTELDGAESAGARAEAGRFLMDLRTASLFGARKVLLLRDAEKWLRQHADALTETLPRIAPGNTLVIALGKLDGRTSLARKLKQLGAVFEFRDLYDRPFGQDRPSASSELCQWLVQRARVHGLPMEPAAALFMTDIVGGDPGQLDGELARLAPVLGKQRVTAETLRGALTVSFGATQFDFVDAILQDDARLALRWLQAMCREGLRDKDGRPIESSATFPLVSAWLRISIGKLLEARSELDSGAPLGAVLEKHGGYFRDRFQRQLEHCTVSRLVHMLGALRRAERRLRLTSEDPALLLERLVCEVLLPIRHHLVGE